MSSTGTGIKFPYGKPGGMRPSLAPASVSVQVPSAARKTSGFKPNTRAYDKQPIQQESQQDKAVDEDPELCAICDRERTAVLCWACGYENKNLRVRKPCPRHANIRYLGDLTQCPRCRTPNLKEDNEDVWSTASEEYRRIDN